MLRFSACCLLLITAGLCSPSRSAAQPKPDAVEPPPLVLATGDAAAWDAGSVDRENLHDGQASRRWEHAKSAALTLRTVPADWSAYDHLTFWLHSQRATGSRFMLIIASENPATAGADYYSATITLDFTGWRRYRYYLPSLDSSREPLGWQHITGLSFTATGWGNEPNPQSVVSVGPLTLTHEGKNKGPRMTDQELFEALDLMYPGLEAVGAAYGRGDVAGAKHALAEYYRHRARPRWYFAAGEKTDPRPANPDTAAADRALRHEFRSIGINYTFGPVIDWNFDVTTAPGSKLAPNNEWTWQLNRHSEWVALANAYRDTGDEKYAREFVAQMTQWVRDCPVPEDAGNGARSAWRTIETGIRAAGPWPDVFYRFLLSPEFTDDALLTMVKSFDDHAEHLMAHHTTGNWLTMEGNGLYHVGVLFPEFKAAPQWRDTSMQWLYSELNNQVYPDGVQVELSSGYHHVSLNNFLGAYRIAHLNDVTVPADYLQRLQRMYEFDVYGAMPDRRLPAVQDGDYYNVRGPLREAMTLFPDRPEYRWYATDGKEGTAPLETSHAFPYAGYYVMRSGWQPDANYLFFDGGPFGYGHQHEDKLNLIVHAFGELLLVDPGNYQYERSKWRDYFIDSPAHNVVLVDGLPQRRRGQPRSEYIIKAPLPHVWVTTPAYDYAEATFNEGFAAPVGKNVWHTRRVLFVKPDYWIVCDTLSARDGKPHRYDALFHFADPVQINAAERRLVTANPNAANLSIVARPDPGLSLKLVEGQEDPVQGWLPNPNISSVHPAPVAVFSSEGGGGGAGQGDTNLLWVLAPSRTGAPDPVAAVEAVPGNPLAAHIRFRDGRAADVTFSGGAAADLKAGAAAGHGRAVLAETGAAGQAPRVIVAAP